VPVGLCAAGGLGEHSSFSVPAVWSTCRPMLPSAFSLLTADGNMGLQVDQTAGTLKLLCSPSPPAAQSPTGTVEITVNAGGSISIKADTGGSIKIDGGGTLELTAMQSVKISSQGTVEVSGTQIKLN